MKEEEELYNLDPFDDPSNIDEPCPMRSYPIICSPVNAEREVVFSIDIVIPTISENLKIEQDNESICCEERFENIGEDKENEDLKFNIVPDITSTITVDSSTNTNKPIGSNLKRQGEDNRNRNEKKPKRSIRFVGVTVYYFPRIQGFGCVPTLGACTLGMDARHISSKSYTMDEYLAERRLENEIITERDCDSDAEKKSSLKPLCCAKRRAILEAAGIKINRNEINKCRSIRKSRKFCGCNCRGICDPNKCTCSRKGTKCQNDRKNFPCRCTSENCRNAVGRVACDPGKVKQHYINTMKRLNLQQRLENEFSQFRSMEPEFLSAYANLLISNQINV